jgi:hypothetical protein
MLNAYKMYLAGEKPSSTIAVKGAIQPDCLIVDAASEFLGKKVDYELYICSRNKSDFSENPDNKDEKFIIAEDIKKKFIMVEYTPNLLQLLNDNFGYKFGDDLLQKFIRAAPEDSLDWQPKLASDFPYASPSHPAQAFVSTRVPGEVFVGEPNAAVIDYPLSMVKAPQNITCSNCGELFYYYPNSSMGVPTVAVTQHVYCTHCGHLNVIS